MKRGCEKAFLHQLICTIKQKIFFFSVESYGLSVSEAQQNYNEKKDALPKLAFCMAPMSFNFNLVNH
ncbi:hypothetical protein DZC41_04065 [Acinetobacter haemolyticus]|nr:hypothetical protein [Acinetobacter haemolyticus]